MSLPASLSDRASADRALARWVRRGDDEAPELTSGVLPLGLSPLGWGATVDAALPDGGVPRGAVVEVASERGLAGSTSFAVAACASAQRASMPWVSASTHAWAGARAWCAWVDPWGSLHAPGLRLAGIELNRFLVVQPPLKALAKVALRVAASGVFAVVVVDTVDPRGFSEGFGGAGRTRARAEGSDGSAVLDEEGVRLDRWPTVVRRLAIAVEGSETSLLLLTDLASPRGLPLPVAMRLELARHVEAREASLAPGPPRSRSFLRVAKERHGRVGGAVPIMVGSLVGSLAGSPAASDEAAPAPGAGRRARG